MHRQASATVIVDDHTQRAKCIDGREYIFAQQTVRNLTGAVGQCTEHDRTVTYRLIAGHHDAAGERTARRNGEIIGDVHWFPLPHNDRAPLWRA